MPIIYMITNITNGLKYIGQTNRPLEARWKAHLSKARFGSSTFFHKHIRESGEESFKAELLCEVAAEDADRIESEYISSLRTAESEFGYNRVLVGIKGPRNEEYRKELSARMIGNQRGAGHKRSEEHKEAISKAHSGKPSWALGKKFSDEHKARIGAASKGRRLSEDAKARIGAANRGRVRTAQSIEKQKAAMIGAKQSEETKVKMAESRRQWWASRKASQTNN